MHKILDLTSEQEIVMKTLFMEVLEDDIRESRKVEFDLSSAQVEHGMYRGECMFDEERQRVLNRDFDVRELEKIQKIEKMYDNALSFGNRFTRDDYKKFL